MVFTPADTQFIYQLLCNLPYPVSRQDVLAFARYKRVGEDMYDLLWNLRGDHLYENCRDIIDELPLGQYQARVQEYF